jgi:hypothetical protein
MDALLQIIVPKLNETKGLSVFQPKFELDGVEYPQGPKRVSWRDISLMFDQQTGWLKKLLPSKFLNEDCVWLKVSDETLDQYDISVKIPPQANGERPLETFLRFLLADMDCWVIAFILHYDQVDSVYELDLEDSIAKLRANLSGKGTCEGFIAFKR